MQLNLPLTLMRIVSVALVLLSPLAYADEKTNKIGITMVNIPAGSFLMGSCKVSSNMAEENKKRVLFGQAPISASCSNPDSDASDNETPQHRVSLHKFQMGKTEVTLGQFKKFVAATGSTSLVDHEFIKYNAYGDNAPVVHVSWEDAEAFIEWLNKTEGGGYRLPTEAEWEYACRAGSYATYCGSNSISEVAWYISNSKGHQHTVGRKKANAFGLYDMSGNAWEWVKDSYHDSYSGAPADGAAWQGGNALHVLRGGSWLYYAEIARASNRLNFVPANRYPTYGFRLARTRP